MPSIGHIAVGAAAGRLQASRDRRLPLSGAMAAFSALSLLPDADGIAFLLGIPYGAAWGHRAPRIPRPSPWPLERRPG